jgi:2-dehydro-3-deoxyphosphogluconate aldolase/(4S)-4-hydroxy-2-oxoglutarate aldolase
MTKSEVCTRIREIGIIPAIKVSSNEDAHFAAEAVMHGGIPIVEITMAVPGAVDLITHLVRFHPKLLVGAGTVLNTDTARACVDAGASFLTSPGFVPKVVEFAVKQNLSVLPGALTPTEVIAAWEAGSDFVKVFPAGSVGGPKYIKALKGPLPDVPLIPTGGVNLQTAAEFLEAGAAALGIGGELVHPGHLKSGNTEAIVDAARTFVAIVKETRAKK